MTKTRKETASEWAGLAREKAMKGEWRPAAEAYEIAANIADERNDCVRYRRAVTRCREQDAWYAEACQQEQETALMCLRMGEANE